jgi:hypothetical protein
MMTDTMFGGIPVLLTQFMYDGVLYYYKDSVGPVFWLGTKPVDNKEWCRREALRIVHAGLKDVLEYIGEEQYTPPMPYKEFLSTLRR